MSRGSKSKGEAGRSSLLSQQENDKFEELLGRRCAVSSRAEGFSWTSNLSRFHVSYRLQAMSLFAAKANVELKQVFLVASLRNVIATVVT